MTYDYTRHPFGDWENRRINPLFPALEFGRLASDTNAPPNDIELGTPRTMDAITRIRVPEGYRTDLPRPNPCEDESLRASTRLIASDGKEIVVERNIVVLKSKVSEGGLEEVPGVYQGDQP